jgi:hypothetical protein
MEKKHTFKILNQAGNKFTRAFRIKETEIMQAVTYSTNDDMPDFLRRKLILSEENIVYDYRSLLNLEKMSLCNDCVIARFELKNLNRKQFSDIIEHNIAVVHHIRTIAERDRLLAFVDCL